MLYRNTFWQNEWEKLHIQSIFTSNCTNQSIWHTYRQFQAQSNHTITRPEKKEKKSSDSYRKKKDKKSLSSSGLMVDCTKIQDVFHLLTKHGCFQRRQNEERDVEYLTVWGRLFQTVVAWNLKKDLCPDEAEFNIRGCYCAKLSR